MLNRPFSRGVYSHRDDTASRETRKGFAMFLLRSAFWLTIVILLIPADPQSGEAPRVTVVNAFMAAQATVADFSGFCTRNPEVCTTGSAAIEVFAEKAENGVEMIYHYIDGTEPADAEAGHGTLTNDDLVQPWQGDDADGAI
jgi:hypothetical protein